MSISTISILGCELFVQCVYQGVAVYQAAPGQDFQQVLTAMGAVADYTKLPFENAGWPVYGFVFRDPKYVERALKPPKRLKAYAAPSDTTNAVYTVMMDVETGTPVSCTCPAGARGVWCKHLYRAQVWTMGTLMAAAQHMIASEDSPLRDLEHFWVHFDMVQEMSSQNEAIERAIVGAFGEDHEHAVDYKQVMKNHRSWNRREERDDDISKGAQQRMERALKSLTLS